MDEKDRDPKGRRSTCNKFFFFLFFSRAVRRGWRVGVLFFSAVGCLSDRDAAEKKLTTSLPAGFVGVPYSYNDTGISEGWMKSFGGRLKALSSSAAERRTMREEEEESITQDLLENDAGVVKAQVASSMDSLLNAVVEGCMNDAAVIRQPEIVTTRTAVETGGVATVSEQPVWGLDCYTRKNVVESLPGSFSDRQALAFVERYLLPAINSLPPLDAHSMRSSLVPKATAAGAR